MSGLGFQEPPGPDDAANGHRRHWVLDVEPGSTIEDLAASLVGEAQAIADLQSCSVHLRRGEPDELLHPGEGEWMEVTPEMRRPDLPEW